MRVSIAPEDIIWEYVSNCLQGHPERDLQYRQHFRQMPLEIDLSADFLALWKKTAAAAIGREVTSVLGFRPVLFLENDQVARACSMDETFWRHATLAFSNQAVFRLWEDLVGRPQGQPPVWQKVTPADALLLAILDPRLTERYDFAWLHGADAPWLVVAMFLYRWSYYNPPDLPWRIYFENPDRVPLPLREILLEHTASFFEALAYAIHRYSQAESVREMTLAKPAQRRIRFFFEHSADILRTAAPKAFSLDLIRDAVACWTGSGTLGLDDGRYLEGAVERFGVLRQIEAYRREALAVAAVRTSGTPTAPDPAGPTESEVRE